jgi:hypothetical protein
MGNSVSQNEIVPIPLSGLQKYVEGIANARKVLNLHFLSGSAQSEQLCRELIDNGFVVLSFDEGQYETIENIFY